MDVKPKILLVDDKLENIIALEKLLSTFEVETVRALSGNEALSKTLEHEFAIALIDVQMPDMDGYETVKLMREVNHTKYLPVIFISAIYSENHYLIEGIEAGAVDFITKPIIPRIFRGKVKIFIELYKQRVQLQNEIDCRKRSADDLLKAERELLEAKAKAENADKLKSVFLSNMSHELRTPLNSIIGFANLMREKHLTPELRNKYVDYINNAGETLLALISDIIDFSKIEADQLSITSEPVNVNDVMNELLEIYKRELERRNKSNVSLQVVLPDHCEKLVIELDAFRFRQILANLLMNAVKYTQEGFIEFGYTINDMRYIYFYVKDSGVGIAPENLNAIFERFFQVENSRQSSILGNGLGLAITKKLTELLGGEIWVESRVGEGSVFHVTLPFVQHLPDDENKGNLSKNTGKPVHVPKKLNAKQILIAEDEEINFFFLKEALRNENVMIYWGKNGQEALDLFNKHQDIEIVLMDLKMPVMNGYQAREKIKAIRDVPVIAQTAFAMAGEKEIIMNAGFDGYLIKPIDLNLLRSLLDKYLNKSTV